MVPKLQKGHKKWTPPTLQVFHWKLLRYQQCPSECDCLLKGTSSSWSIAEKAYGRLWLPFLGTSLLKKKKKIVKNHCSPLSICLQCAGLRQFHSKLFTLKEPYLTEVLPQKIDQLFLENNSAPEADDSHPQTYSLGKSTKTQKVHFS